MKITYISLYYRKDRVTGANKRFDEVGQLLQSIHGADLSVVVTDGNQPAWIDRAQVKTFSSFQTLLQRMLVYVKLTLWLLFQPKSIVYTDFMPVPILGLRKHSHYQLIHDLRSFTKFSRSVVGKLSSFAQTLELRLCENIVCVSEFTKKELIELCGISKEKIVVSYNGVHDFKITKDVNKNLKRDLDVLYVATFEERKNHIALIKALGIINKPLKVVLIGRDLGLRDFVLAEAKFVSERVEGLEIEFIDSVSEADLERYYLRSNVFVSPALYEGFGMPVIEGMNYGCKVACSDIEVFREVAAEAASYFDPGDPKSIAIEIQNQLESGNRPSLANASNIKRFHWGSIAQTLNDRFQDSWKKI